MFGRCYDGNQSRNNTVSLVTVWKPTKENITMAPKQRPLASDESDPARFPVKAERRNHPQFSFTKQDSFTEAKKSTPCNSIREVGREMEEKKMSVGTRRFCFVFWLPMQSVC